MAEPQKKKLEVESDPSNTTARTALGVGTLGLSEAPGAVGALQKRGEESNNWLADKVGGGVKSLFQAPQIGEQNVDDMRGTLTGDLAKQIIDRSSMSPMELAEQSMAGTDQSGALHGSLEAQAAQRGALGGPQDPTVAAALQARSERQYASDLNTQKRGAQDKAHYEAGRMANRAFQTQKAVSDLQIKRSQFYKQQIQNNKALRNNAVAALFGGLGTAIGAVGGAAVGGGAGAQMGAGLGGTFGSAMKGTQPIQMGESAPQGSTEGGASPLVGGY